MFGGVSLSSAYSKDAQNLVIFYYDHYYGGKKEYISPNNPFVMTKAEIEEMKSIYTLRDKKEDFKILKEQLECYGLSVPTLYKQYADLCEEGGITFMGYNVDKDFNNCVDSLILVEIDKIKEKKEKDISLDFVVYVKYWI